MPNRTDNFNRANNASSPGTPSDGGFGYSGALIGTWGIESNQGYCASNTGHAVLFTESSLPDVRVQLTLAVAGTDSGLCARYVSTNNYLVVAANATTGYKLFKNVAGVFTQIGATYSTLPANGDVVALVANGSALEVFVNGVSRITGTDATHSTGTLHGLRANNDTVARFDDFSIVNVNSIAFGGTVPAQTGTTGSAMTALGLSSYFSGGVAPYAYSVFSGTLPTGLSLNASTGSITGTPTLAGSYSAVVRATDSSTPTATTANTGTIAWTISAPAATATTLTGPTGGIVSGASAPFTVGANGVISGTVTVTPSDGGGGGTFAATIGGGTSVTISAGTPTATFTYTPGSVGAKTISISGGGLTAPASLTYTASTTTYSMSCGPFGLNTGSGPLLSTALSYTVWAGVDTGAVSGTALNGTVTTHATTGVAVITGLPAAGSYLVSLKNADGSGRWHNLGTAA